MRTLILLVTLLTTALSNQTGYDGYKVYEVTPKNSRDIKVLDLFYHGTEFDFWSLPSREGLPATVMVTPKAQRVFTTLLDLKNIKYRVLIENVATTIQEEQIRQAKAPKAEKGRITFTQYHRYDEIQDYIAQLATTYPDIVSLEDIAVSTEGRSLTLVKVSTGGSNKPIIFFESGIHAREWIAPAVSLYILQQLVENPNNRHLIETVDWYIIPVVNPDGYEFTHSSILTRLWRKTRSPGSLLCSGVDGNRNFDYHWLGTGASTNQCSDTFAGSAPFSEPETAGVRDAVLKYKENIKFYLSVHSFGLYLLYPWGWTATLPDNAEQIQALGESVRDAIQAVDGTTYVVGSSTNVLYFAAGNSVDWAAGVGGIDLSLTIELPGGGLFGFDIPAARIVPVAEETWEGIVVVHNYIAENFVTEI